MIHTTGLRAVNEQVAPLPVGGNIHIETHFGAWHCLQLPRPLGMVGMFLAIRSYKSAIYSEGYRMRWSSRAPAAVLAVVVAAGLIVGVSSSIAGAETPAERCARETSAYNSAWAATWAASHPGNPGPAPAPPVPYVCVDPGTAPTTTTAPPTTTQGLPTAQSPGGGPNVGVNAPTNFPTYNGTPIVPVPPRAPADTTAHEDPSTAPPTGASSPSPLPVIPGVLPPGVFRPNTVQYVSLPWNCIGPQNDDGSCELADCPFGRAHPGTDDTSCKLGNWDEPGRIWDMAGYAMDVVDVISLANPMTAAGKYAIKLAVKSYLEKRAKDNITQEVAEREAKDLAARLAREMDDAVQAGKNCANSFTGDTTVVMADGTSRAIASVAIGDTVLATNPVDGFSSPQQVTGLIRSGGHHKMVKVATQPGIVLDATTDHPFWNAATQSFTDAGALRVGDTITTIGGGVTEVTDVTPYNADLTAYNLQVSVLHTYHVGPQSVLVHNKCANPLTGKQQSDLAEWLGYKKIPDRSNGQAIFQKGNKYISYDVDGHNGGVWKSAGSIKDLGSKNTRDGTFNYDLTQRIGD